jgi:hypothetical protein
MKLMGNYSRWLILAIALLHSVLFFFIAYFSYEFDRSFHWPWVLAIFFLWVAYILFAKRQWEKALSAIAFGGTIVWFLFASLSSDSFEWGGLVWFLPALLALGLLFVPSAQPVERLT